MKKRFFARRESIIYTIVALVVWSILIGVALLEVKEKEYIGVFSGLLLLPWSIALPLGYNSIIFEADHIVYKKNLFFRQCKISYKALNKIYIDYTGCTVSYYKGAKPRIVLFFNGGTIETNIRCGILYNLISKKPEQCRVKIALTDLCPHEHQEILNDYLTKKQRETLKNY